MPTKGLDEVLSAQGVLDLSTFSQQFVSNIDHIKFDSMDWDSYAKIYAYNKNGDIVCDFGVMSDNYNYFGDIISKDEIDGKLYLLVEPEDNTLVLWTLS